MSDYSTRFESLLKRVLNSLTCVGFRSISFNWGIAARFQARHVFLTVTFKGAAREGAEGDQAPPLAIRILIFIFLVFHQHCTVNRDRVDCKMFFGCTTGVATHSLSNQAVMNFRDLRNIEAAFFIPACCVFCTTIYNKSWVLPCSASVETSTTFELPTVSIDV